jgi:hypothetical protein
MRSSRLPVRLNISSFSSAALILLLSCVQLACYARVQSTDRLIIGLLFVQLACYARVQSTDRLIIGLLFDSDPLASSGGV